MGIYIKGEFECCECDARIAYDFEVKEFQYDRQAVLIAVPHYPPGEWSEHDGRYYCPKHQDDLERARNSRW